MKRIAPILLMALKELERVLQGSLSGKQVDNIVSKISAFAIYSAIAGTASVFSGIGSVVAILTQTGLVWSLYVMINKELGISMKEETVKFIASAMLTNLVCNAGTYLVTCIAAWILSMFPIFAPATFVIGAVLGYVLIYISAVVYIKLLTEVMKTSGTYQLGQNDATKQMVKNVVESTNVKEIIKEAREEFKKAEERGDLKNPKCPYCGEPIDMEQKFCTNCGGKLK